MKARLQQDMNRQHAFFVLKSFIFIALLFSLAAPGMAQGFQADIDRWTAQDALDAPTPGAILFAGSSSIRRWEQLALDFADYKIIQRGFGGSRFDELNKYINDIVLPYHPSAIVVWEGTNDLAIGDDGNEVIADYKQFVDSVHAAQPNVEIFYIGIMPTMGRKANRPQEAISNKAIAAIASENPKLHYIDIPAAFFDNLHPYDDPAFTSKFVDSIHLNREGYQFWTSVIRPQIEERVAPNKVFTPNPKTLQPGNRLLFDFGPSNSEDGSHTVGPDINGNYWNNWHPATAKHAVNAGEHIANLVDTDGVPTGIKMTITGGFVSNGKQDGGLLPPKQSSLGDMAIETATQDFFFSRADGKWAGGDDDIPGGFMLEGLDPNISYRFRFLGSHRSNETLVTEYAVIGAGRNVTTLQTSGKDIGSDGVYDGNDDTIAVVTDVRPDQFGQVFVDITVHQGTFAFINAMEVRADSLAADIENGCDSGPK